MKKFIDQETSEQIKNLFREMTSPVRMLLFIRERDCPYGDEQRRLLEEIKPLSDRLQLQVYDFDRDRAAATQYGVDKVPATVILSNRDHGIKFYGLTAGHEFTSLINALIMVGTQRTGLPPELEEIVRQISKPVHLEVMVTLTCPYCPQAVFAAHQLAFVSEQITADAVDASEFPDLSRRYDVSSVPKTVINGRDSFVGGQPAPALVTEILKAVDPQLYEKNKDAIQETRQHRRVRRPDPEHEYEIIIIGGGPAALSAALYAGRKALDTLLIARELGGQMINTAVIENYLGLPGISGKELAEQFIYHAEQYPIAEAVNTTVTRVTVAGRDFAVQCGDDRRFRGRALIYCAGKEYQTLAVPGEKEYLGRGISFCAICDAPLYQGKRVAVIGGGNSAFTAVRDLARFAREIFLIHRRRDFRADPVLVEEVRKLKGVRIYPETIVREFKGGEKLTSLRLHAADRSSDFELEVDGVFLQIGLVPNTEPVKDLITLNEHSEIPVAKDNSTTIPGFFAAGDATDVPGKQIIIAGGEGAKASISAYNYLIKEGLIEKQIQDESWT